MSVGSRIGIAFALGLLLLAAVGASAYLSTQGLLEANRWVVHTHKVEEKLDDLLAQHLDAETDERAFLTSGNEQYVKAFDAAAVQVRADLDAVVLLTRDNASHQPALKQLRQLSDARLGDMRRAIELRGSAGVLAVLPILFSDRDKKAMDNLRAVVVELESSEHELLSKRNVAAQSSATRALWTIAVWMPTGLVLMAVLAVVLLRTAQFGGPRPEMVIAAEKWPAIALRYAIAAAVVVLATLLRWGLAERFGPLPIYLTFFPAVLFAAAIGGGGPGILATLLAVAASAAWFTRVEASGDVVSLGIFTAVSLCLSVVAERLRRSRWAEALSVAQHERAEELARKNEQVTQQAEELAQQAEELAQQNEELQSQAEEIRALNDDLHHREHLLETFVEVTRRGTEQAAMKKICEAALQAFGDAAAAVLVCEEQDQQLMVRAIAGARRHENMPEILPLEHTFVNLVIQQNRVACLNDVSLRPDLYIFPVPGHDPFQAELCAPMLRDGKAFGAVAIYSSRPHHWTEDQFRLAEWLAAQCAQTLEVMRVQQALRESEDRFRSMVDAISQMAWIARPDGWVTWYNRRWYEYTGTTPEQMEGWGWKSVQDPALLPAVMERWQHSLDSGERFDMIFPLRGADGAFHPFLTRVVPLKDAQGRVLQWFGTNTDFSEQKAVEEQLEAARTSAEQAKAAAELANSAKDRFLAILSHELRTPLTPVVMGLAMLRDEPHLSPAMRDTLAMVRRNIEMEARLIDDLLDVMRITRGKIELQRATIALGTVISCAIEVCKADIESKALDLRVDLGLDAPYWINGDAARLQQVFWNLLNNAVKFSPPGGRLVVRARREDAQVVVEVTDSGIGIEPEALSRVFNAFEQGERSITRQFGGMGLGLTISRAMVEMHGGTIEAFSEGRNQGATFRIRLPLAAPPSQPPPSSSAAAAAPPRPARHFRILLAEDHGATAQMLCMVLTSDGHTVETAHDVAAALELADTQPFDLLVSDLGLPDGSGHDLLRELRRRGHKLPAIALSGFGQQEDVARSYEAGFGAHLTKPASRATLLEAVASVAAGGPVPPTGIAEDVRSQFDPNAFRSDAALEQCLGKRDLLEQMVQIFFDDFERLLPPIEAAAKRGDLAEARKLAHRLKGTILHLAAEPAREAAERVEQLAHAGAAAEAEKAIARFVERCIELKAALSDYRAAMESQAQ